MHFRILLMTSIGSSITLLINFEHFMTWLCYFLIVNAAYFLHETRLSIAWAHATWGLLCSHSQALPCTVCIKWNVQNALMGSVGIVCTASWSKVVNSYNTLINCHLVWCLYSPHMHKSHSHSKPIFYSLKVAHHHTSCTLMCACHVTLEQWLQLF